MDFGRPFGSKHLSQVARTCTFQTMWKDKQRRLDNLWEHYMIGCLCSHENSHLQSVRPTTLCPHAVIPLSGRQRAQPGNTSLQLRMRGIGTIRAYPALSTASSSRFVGGGVQMKSASTDMHRRTSLGRHGEEMARALPTASSFNTVWKDTITPLAERRLWYQSNGYTGGGGLTSDGGG